MRYTETIYYAGDFEAAVAFHRDVLGLEVQDRQNWGWALLTSDDGARVGILDAKHGNAESGVPSPRLSFRTDDLEAEVKTLQDRGVKCDPILGEPGSTRAINFYDADGNVYFLWEEA